MYKIRLWFLNRKYDRLFKEYLNSLGTEKEYEVYQKVRDVVLKINEIEDVLSKKTKNKS